MSKPIDFDALVAWLASPSACILAVSTTIHKRRFHGNDKDFAHGTVEAHLHSPFGPLRITSGWSAFSQPNPVSGWYIEPRPDAKGQGIVTGAGVFMVDEGEKIHLESNGEELASLAWDFWSYQDLASHICQHLSR